MKKLIIPALAVLCIFFACSEDVDYSNKKEQELWVDGRVKTSSSVHADSKLSYLTILFFDVEVSNNFGGENYQTGFDTYYLYTHLSEDPIYSKLIDDNRLLFNDGSTAKPLFIISTDDDEITQVTLPVGEYFVVAFYFMRGTDRSYWNKYATRIYSLESRYNPQYLSVVLPVDFTQYGRIDWVGV
ncbi:MAG: hypothetical protein ACK5LR_10005 [Mangrovibacterium sp.]